ncbi:ATPase [Tamlana haliotis]|uniref:ATPase n=1 Tax=Pseudotamlana haliotis TaxID=2614804 RepID=A0A6N6MGI2_9FLAO|nr:ATPase [Tamlana haliotis]KAB1068973.1 ATPase [Tamlana haliotis]
MNHSTTIFNAQKPHIIVEGAITYQLGELKGNQINYNFQKILIYLEAKGKLLFGKHFKIHQEDHEVLLKLISYYVHDEAFCVNLGIDIQKGILLSGPVGCGKTTLMKLLPFVAPHKRPFKCIPARNIVFSFNNIGYKTIEDYTDQDTYCFDDLGVEQKGKHYGADCNVMGEIILSRYDLFCDSGRIPNQTSKRKIFTHITTNLNAQELEEKYGERVRSRMRSMFNLVAFDGNTRDKRK